MKIVVVKDKHKFKLRLPMFLLKLKEVTIELDGEEVNIINNVYEILKQYKKKYGSFELVNVESANGENIKIII